MQDDKLNIEETLEIPTQQVDRISDLSLSLSDATGRPMEDSPIGQIPDRVAPEFSF